MRCPKCTNMKLFREIWLDVIEDGAEHIQAIVPTTVCQMCYTKFYTPEQEAVKNYILEIKEKEYKRKIRA